MIWIVVNYIVDTLYLAFSIQSYRKKNLIVIDLMAVKVRKVIIDEVKKAKYYSISVDSTPDCAHIDQLSIILRYVSPTDYLPVERFIGFLTPTSHKGEDLANLTVNFLENQCKLDIKNCRGQSYDNAANMSGKYNGMQQRIQQISLYAIYIPCAAHSLNLVGRSAVDFCLIAVSFFATVQQIYKFLLLQPKKVSERERKS